MDLGLYEEGLVETIFPALWKKPLGNVWHEDQNTYKFEFSVPNTIIYSRHRPTGWYFTSSKTELDIYNNRMKRKRTVSEGDIYSEMLASNCVSDVIAKYSYVELEGEKKQVKCMYLNARSLNSFLHKKQNVPPDGVLQSFVDPKPSPDGYIRNSAIQSIYQFPNVCLLEKRENRNIIVDSKLPMQVRCETFEGYTNSKPVHIASIVLHTTIRKACDSICQHIRRVSGKSVQKVVFMWKIDQNNSLWLLECSEIRLAKAGTSVPRAVSREKGKEDADNDSRAIVHRLSGLHIPSSESKTSTSPQVAPKHRLGFSPTSIIPRRTSVTEEVMDAIREEDDEHLIREKTGAGCLSVDSVGAGSRIAILASRKFADKSALKTRLSLGLIEVKEFESESGSFSSDESAASSSGRASDLGASDITRTSTRSLGASSKQKSSVRFVDSVQLGATGKRKSQSLSSRSRIKLQPQKTVTPNVLNLSDEQIAKIAELGVASMSSVASGLADSEVLEYELFRRRINHEMHPEPSHTPEQAASLPKKAPLLQNFVDARTPDPSFEEYCKQMKALEKFEAKGLDHQCLEAELKAVHAEKKKADQLNEKVRPQSRSGICALMQTQTIAQMRRERQTRETLNASRKNPKRFTFSLDPASRAH